MTRCPGEVLATLSSKMMSKIKWYMQKFLLIWVNKNAEGNVFKVEVNIHYFLAMLNSVDGDSLWVLWGWLRIYDFLNDASANLQEEPD